MANIDNIVEKLISNAEKQAQEILEKGKIEAEKIREDNLSKAEDNKKRILDKAELEADSLYESIVQHSNIRSRDEENSEKEKIIDEVFQKAKDKLLKLDDEEYFKILNKELRKYKGPLTLYLPENKKIRTNFFDKAKLKLSDIKVINDKKIESGFIIEQGKIRYNYDFSRVVDFRKDDLESKIVEILKLD